MDRHASDASDGVRGHVSPVDDDPSHRSPATLQRGDLVTALLEATLAEEGGEIALMVLVPESHQTAMHPRHRDTTGLDRPRSDRCQLVGRGLVGFLEDAVVIAQEDSTLVIDRQGDVDHGGEPPLTITHDCCGSAQGMEAGNSFVIGHELAREVWVFDPDSGRWRQVDPRPSTGFVLGTAYLDGELIVVNAAPRPAGPVSSETLSTVAALDQSSGTWRNLSALPEPIMVGGVGDDGLRAFIAGTAHGPNNNILGSAQPLVFEYRSGDGFEALPPIPIHGQAATVAWVEGAGLLGWNYDLESAILDDSGEWRSAGAVPMDPAECYPRSQSVITGAIAFCGGIAYFEGATEAWHPVPIYFGVASWYGTTTNSVIGLVQVARDEAVLIEYPLTGAGE